MDIFFQKGKAPAGLPREGGFILIVSVIVLATIGAALVTSFLSSSVGGFKVARLDESSAQARGLADACAEVGLQKLVTSSSYTGTGTVTAGTGSCAYGVSTSGSLDTVIATGTVGTVLRKVKVTVSLPSLLIASWQEVGDF